MQSNLKMASFVDLCSGRRDRRFEPTRNTADDSIRVCKRVWPSQQHEETQLTKRQRTQMSSYFAPVRIETSEFYDILEPLVIEKLQQSAAMCEIILAFMSRNKSDLKLQLCGIRALRSCKWSISNPNEYVDGLTTAMKEHFECLPLQLEAIKAVRSWVTIDKTHSQALSEPSTIQVILQALCRHSHSLKLQYLGLDLLRLLSTSSQKGRLCIAQQTNFMSTLLSILETNLGDLTIQQIGLSLLSWIAESNDSREIVLKEGGCEYVLRAMKKHETDQTVQCNGTASLCWLIHAGNEASQDGLFTSNTRDDIRTLLQRIMHHHVNNASVFGNCMCILSEIQSSSNPAALTTSRLQTTNAVSEADQELAELVTLGMRRHPQSSKVQRNCLTFLRLLATDRTDIHHVLLERKCLDLIMIAMKQHPKDADIQTQACGVLAALCDASTEGKQRVSGSNCVEAVLNCQLEHQDNVRIQQAVAWFHSCMLHNASNASAVASFGGGMRVVEAMLHGVVLDL